MNIEQARFNMIEQQIRPWDVLDAGVLELLAVVKREDFVPVAHKALAFMDTEIPLGDAAGVAKGQVMLAPRVEARLLQELKVARHEKVLEVGTGSGFMAALLGHRAQRVISMELDAALAEQAAANLKRAGVLNVTVLNQDGAKGLASEAPFDVIALSGSVEAVPEELLQQLKVGGRLAVVIGDEPVMRAQVFTRVSEKDFSTRILFDTVAPRLQGFAHRNAFAF